MTVFTRRTILRAALALPVGGVARADTGNPLHALAMLERQAGGRLGAAAWRRGGAGTIVWRGDERFPLCSTAKVMVAAAVRARASQETNLLTKRVHYAKADLVAWSPVTEQHVNTGMTVAELCAAALQVSDNGACNLLLDKVGGPAAVTAFARGISDTTFRLDRRETELNTAVPGDPRDTTPPRAMATSLEALLLDAALAPDARRQLLDWMFQTKTGADRIRTGFPAAWCAADKTGTGSYGTTNDVDIVLPQQGEPAIVAIYYTRAAPDADADSKVLADAAAIVARSLGAV